MVIQLSGLGRCAFVGAIIWSWVLAGLAIAAPVLEARRSPVASAIYGFLSHFCHQRPSRSWFLFGSNFGLCARDFAIYASVAAVGTLVLACERAWLWLRSWRSVGALVLITPLVIDGSLQLAGVWMSTNPRRTLTGALAGLGVTRISMLLAEGSWGGRRVLTPKGLARATLSCLLGLALIAAPPAFAQMPQAAERVLLKQGTPVFLVFPDVVSSETVTTGQTINLRVFRDVKAGGATAIASGARATAVVTEARKRSGWGGKGVLSVRVDQVETVDGQFVPLSATQRAEGEGKAAAATATGVITGIICLPVALTGFAIKGEEGRIAPGTEIKAFTDAEVTVALNKGGNEIAPATVTPVAAPQPVGPAAAEAAPMSGPDRAESLKQYEACLQRKSADPAVDCSEYRKALDNP